jgi:hypothetical protein
MRWLFIVVIWVAGCAAHHQEGYAPGQERYYPLLPPSSYGGVLILEQLIEGSAKGEHFQLHVQLEIDPDQLRVVGFTAFRTKAFALRYDGRTLDFENFTDRRMPFPPAMILSDMQKVLWPNLPDREAWHIVDDPAAKVRLVFFDGRLMTRIQYHGGFPTGGGAELNDVQYGYRLDIHILSSWGG